MAHLRCSRCGARARHRHPDTYTSPGRVPRCKTPGCFNAAKRSGKPQLYRVDHWRERHEVGPKAPKPCNCPEYPFPHRHGSGYCIHNLAITAEDCRRRAEG